MRLIEPEQQEHFLITEKPLAETSKPADHQ